MKKCIIYNCHIINEGSVKKGNILINNNFIEDVIYNSIDIESLSKKYTIIDAKGKYLMPGAIDDQVHFRDPGLTHKADIYTESKAAVAGGITSYMEMPNTVPQATDQVLLEEKYLNASIKSLANYSFYIGATNNNVEELLKTNPSNVCGIKIFMGSSTGNMLVDKEDTLRKIFSKSKLLIATHCEDETTIQQNSQQYREKYGEDVPMQCHPEIRSAEACYTSSSFAVKLAKEYGTRLHVLHLSTEKELSLFDPVQLNPDKKITSEVCIHHLWFDSNDYDKKGTLIKWNPAVKTPNDKNALLKGLLENRIDVIATDHAPHTKTEKENSYFKAPSGGPMVQHALVSMLELYHNNKIRLEKIVEKMCHAPANLFNINKRGYIRKGYYADLVLVDLHDPWKVAPDNILYKCKWSPMEGQTYQSKVTHTFVNGNLAYENGNFNEEVKGMRLEFDR